DCTGHLGISSLMKCTSAIRQMAYGAVPDSLDEYLQMGATKARRNDHKRILYKTKHEAARKDVERAFGVLKLKWKLIKYLARGMTQSRLLDVIEFAETHNVVAFLEKPEESDGFAEIIDFLKASSVSYALTVNPVIYTSCIEQFWATARYRQLMEYDRCKP
ncbi:ALP1-like protein, partial [Tanacetum coccineum]